MIKYIKAYIKELRKPYHTNRNKKYNKYDIGDYTYVNQKSLEKKILFQFENFVLLQMVLLFMQQENIIIIG
jgi:hypothetical protein